MRKFLLGFIVGMVVMIPVTAFGQTSYEKISAYVNPDIKLAVEGEYVDLDLAPIVYDQRTYLPVRELVEKVMGYEVNWNQATTTVEISSPDIWPVKDISKVEGDDVTKVINFSDLGYDEFYNINPEMDVDEIKKLIRRLKNRIDQHETVIEASSKPTSGEFYTNPELVEPWRTELTKLQEALPKWESLLESKKQEQPAE